MKTKKIIITIEDDDEIPLTTTNYPWMENRHNPCEGCPNNPANNPHASGFCNCALPAFFQGPFW